MTRDAIIAALAAIERRFNERTEVWRAVIKPAPEGGAPILVRRLFVGTVQLKAGEPENREPPRSEPPQQEG